MLSYRFAPLLLLLAACSVPVESVSSSSTPLATSCGWVDPGCNPHDAPATVALCVTATGGAGLLPASVAVCDMEPVSALRVPAGESWNTWVRPGSTGYSVEAVPCSNPTR
jgi:hypothetical protein